MVFEFTSKDVLAGLRAYHKEQAKLVEAARDSGVSDFSISLIGERVQWASDMIQAYTDGLPKSELKRLHRERVRADMIQTTVGAAGQAGMSMHRNAPESWVVGVVEFVDKHMALLDSQEVDEQSKTCSCPSCRMMRGDLPGGVVD